MPSGGEPVGNLGSSRVEKGSKQFGYLFLPGDPRQCLPDAASVLSAYSDIWVDLGSQFIG
jgi:hypothetical protein